MKAAVVYQRGEAPRYTEDFPEPIANSEDELVIRVKASAIKHLDKSRASGKHYSTNHDDQAQIIGGDGVGLLADGTRVFALGVSGMIAEKAVIDKRRIVNVPDGIDDATAAALPNAVAGSAMALRFRAAMKTGETVLINGATGFTGKIAVQVARHYGAKKVIVTGRNEQALQSLLGLGADETVAIIQSDEEFIQRIQYLHNDTPIGIIIDYLWGHSAELILASLKGKGAYTHKTRFVSVGSITGDKILISSEILRSVDLQLSGSGLGSWTGEEMQMLFGEIIPEMFQMAARNQLKVDTTCLSLKEIERLWDMEPADGKRLVVTI